MTNTQNTPTICTCDDNGIHYLCEACEKYHDNELDALFCCLIADDSDIINDKN